MSSGLVICSICKREVHQEGADHGWIHCQDQTPRCTLADSIYPDDYSQIVGPYCGKDDLNTYFGTISS